VLEAGNLDGVFSQVVDESHKLGDHPADPVMLDLDALERRLKLREGRTRPCRLSVFHV
jgi:hypothetical protein